MGKRVLIAMSGGIDSSVAAMILLEQGYELVGVTFRTFDSINESCLARERGCCSVDAIFEAKHLAEKLGFEHHILDVRKHFRETVIADFICQYLECRTPNPCVLCNPVIKWGRVLQMADELNCDYLATGHYARIGIHNGRHFLKKGTDNLKDQTYFLWKLTSEQLQRTLFPLGDMTKPEVREMAHSQGFKKLSQKKESEEICFVTDDNYRNFLRAEVPDIDNLLPSGDILDKTGKKIGVHNGLYNYTVGQRKGLGVALGSPAYVVELMKDSNSLIVGQRSELYHKECIVSELNFTKYDDFNDGTPVICKTRYRNAGDAARLYHHNENSVKVVFDNGIFAITPGQSAVFYENDDLIGGGIIDKTI